MTAVAAERADRLRTEESRQRLAALLAQSRDGNVPAFMAFYDATCAVAYRLELCRTRDRVDAEEAVCARYLQAWLRAKEQPRSGLSPLAWLLGLAVPLDQPDIWIAG